MSLLESNAKTAPYKDDDLFSCPNSILIRNVDWILF